MASVAMDDVFPVIVEGMEKNLKWHWSSSVRQLTENVKQMLEEMDPTLNSKCVQEMENRELKVPKDEAERTERWEVLEQIVTSR